MKTYRREIVNREEGVFKKRPDHVLLTLSCGHQVQVSSYADKERKGNKIQCRQCEVMIKAKDRRYTEII